MRQPCVMNFFISSWGNSFLVPFCTVSITWGDCSSFGALASALRLCARDLKHQGSREGWGDRREAEFFFHY